MAIEKTSYSQSEITSKVLNNEQSITALKLELATIKSEIKFKTVLFLALVLLTVGVFKILPIR